MDGRIVAELEDRRAAGPQDPPQLADVPERHVGVGDVLEHHEGHRHIDARVGQRDRRAVAQVQLDVLVAAEVRAGPVQHLRADVDAMDGGGPVREHAGEAADTTAQIEGRALGGHRVRPAVLKERVEDPLPLAPEPGFLVTVASAVVRQPVVDEEERIFAGAGIPEVGHVGRVGHALHGTERRCDG